MKEIWKDVDGFPGYRVSNKGRVSGPRKSELKLVDGGQGYLKVTLSIEGRHVDKRVNRLVAQAFIPNPNNHPLVMHLDNDRANNDVRNLAWGTHAENNHYCSVCGRHGDGLNDEVRERAYASRRSPVIAINCFTGEEIHFRSQHDAARELGVSQQHIWGVLNGHRRTTGGYRFEYAGREERLLYGEDN